MWTLINITIKDTRAMWNLFKVNNKDTERYVKYVQGQKGTRWIIGIWVISISLKIFTWKEQSQQLFTQSGHSLGKWKPEKLYWRFQETIIECWSPS